MSDERRILSAKRRKRSWRCRFGIHSWGEGEYVGLATIRDTCARCGLERYFHALLNEMFYRRPTPQEPRP